MTILLWLVLVAFGQSPAAPAEVPVVNAGLGPCSTHFLVTDVDRKPIYSATVHVKIRYGFMGVKRMDLQVGTNVDGKASVEGLPTKARPVVYDISKGELKGVAEQDFKGVCNVNVDVVLR